MINISVKNSQNVAKFRVCKTHWCYEKAKNCNIKTEHPQCLLISQWNKNFGLKYLAWLLLFQINQELPNFVYKIPSMNGFSTTP